jgi:AcrR family transcriptional regulator
MARIKLHNEMVNTVPPDVLPADLSPRQRADAQRNRNHLLSSAATTFTQEGPRVTMQRIAQNAGVGIGTLYRHFPDRSALLAALSHRAFLAVLKLAQASRTAQSDPFLALLHFMRGTIQHRDVLVLPLHGAPVTLSAADVSIRRAISAELDQILQSGHQAGTLRQDVNATDIIVFGALLAQSTPHLPDAALAAERAAQIFIDGLRMGGSPLPGQPVSRSELEAGFASWEQGEAPLLSAEAAT